MRNVTKTTTPAEDVFNMGYADAVEDLSNGIEKTDADLAFALTEYKLGYRAACDEMANGGLPGSNYACDDCGDEIKDGDAHPIEALPIGVTNAREGESATLCGICFVCMTHDVRLRNLSMSFVPRFV